MGMAHVTGGWSARSGTARASSSPSTAGTASASFIGLAIVVAAREWWAFHGVVGDVIHAVVAGTFGRVAYAVPLALLVLGMRLLRAPDESSANSRIGIGLVALAFSSSGLAHVSQGIPDPPDGADLMRNAGGIIGFLASSPLEAAVSVYGTVPILLMLGFFGVLVITATVHMIPERLAHLRDHLLHRSQPVEEPAEEKPKRQRRRIGPDADGNLDGDEPFEQAVVAPDGKRLRPGQKRPTSPVCSREPPPRKPEARPRALRSRSRRRSRRRRRRRSRSA